LNRSGAALVETALVLPLLFLFIFGLIIGGVGMNYFQTVSNLAREAARYASVHGTGYQSDPPGYSAVTKANIYSAAIAPKLVGLDPSNLTYAIYYTGASGQTDWDSALHQPQYVNSTTGGTPKTAVVSVTVTYQWSALLYFGKINLSSTAEMPMSH
jgi:Flp pilus assembly protein TadG